MELQTTFNKKVGTGGISGQLYEIYLVLLILLHGLTDKNVTDFHLASNLEEARNFDDVVFAHSYRGQHRVTFLQAKHKEKAKNITLEELLGRSGKGAFDLKKYLRSFREIKRSFQQADERHPIFRGDFERCEFVIYTNASFKAGAREANNVVELRTEEEDFLNFGGGRVVYYQLCLKGNKAEQIRDVLGKDEVMEDFLRKLKICFAQPNEAELKARIKAKIRSCYSVNNVETVFSAAMNKAMEWWKDKNVYLDKSSAFFEDVAWVSVKFDVIDPVPAFTGREQYLLDVHAALQKVDLSMITQITTVNGLGGIGKTELARKYISEYGAFYDNNVVWINAETSATCEDSFRRLAVDKLGIEIQNGDGKKKDFHTIVSEVYAYFTRRDRKSLFVFDNAERTAEVNIKTCLPSGANKPYVLITSRDKKWGGIESLTLELFTEDEAATFIKNSLGDRLLDLDGSDGRSLAKVLQYLPLAIRQAVAYIVSENERSLKWNGRYAIADYLREFEAKASSLLRKAADDLSDNSGKTVLTTWHITIEKIARDEKCGSLALNILNTIAYFAPENISVMTIFTDGEEHLKCCVELLEQYSMINLRKGIVSVHRLLQQVIRIELNRNGMEEGVLRNALSLFNNGLNADNVDHATSCWDHAKLYHGLLKEFSWLPLSVIGKLKFETRYNDAYSFANKTHALYKVIYGKDHLECIEILGWIGEILRDDGKYEASTKVYRKGIEKLEKVVELDNPRVLIMVNNLAVTLKQNGDYAEASRLYQRVLTKTNDVITWLTVKNNLSLSLHLEWKLEEATVVCREVLQKRMELFGPDHPHTLSSMINLGFLLDEQGKLGESAEIYEMALPKSQEVLGCDHPDTLMNINNLALVYRKLGQYKKSTDMHREVLRIQIGKLGPDHPHTLYTMNNLGFVLRFQGGYDEALQLFQTAYEKMPLVLGAKHPSTLTTANNVALMLRTLGKYEASNRLFDDVMRSQTSKLGPDHRDVLITTNNYAFLHSARGNYKEAARLCRIVLHKREQFLPRDHPDILTSMTALALVLSNQGKYKEALKLLRKVINKREEILGCDHPDTLIAMSHTASVLDEQGNHRDAATFCEEALRKQLQVLGKNYPDKLITTRTYASILKHLGEFEQSLTHLRETLSGLESIAGTNLPDVLSVTTDISSVLARQGKLEEAEALCENVLRKQDDLLGDDHPDTLCTMRQLGGIFDAQGKYDEASALLKTVLIKRECVLGRKHPTTLDTRKLLKLVKKRVNTKRTIFEFLKKLFLNRNNV